MKVKSRRQEHAEETRAALVDAAQDLFATHGFDETLTEEIVQRARVTRGALYHHFKGKEEIFRAVFEEVEHHFIEELAQRAVGSADPWQQFVDGCLAYLDLSLDPVYRQIVLLDGPAVLGWERWREIDAQHGFGLLREALVGFIASGVIKPQAPEALAHLLIGAINEAAIAVAAAPDQPRALEDSQRALLGVLDALRV